MGGGRARKQGAQREKPTGSASSAFSGETAVELWPGSCKPWDSVQGRTGAGPLGTWGGSQAGRTQKGSLLRGIPNTAVAGMVLSGPVRSRNDEDCVSLSPG